MSPGLKRILSGAHPEHELLALLSELTALVQGADDPLKAEEVFDAAEDLVRDARRDFFRRAHAAALATDTSERDVHTEHCCVRRTCKYGYDTLTDDERAEFGLQGEHCTVTSGEKVQSYCYDEGEEF